PDVLGGETRLVVDAIPLTTITAAANDKDTVTSFNGSSQIIMRVSHGIDLLRGFGPLSPTRQRGPCWRVGLKPSRGGFVKVVGRADNSHNYLFVGRTILQHAQPAHQTAGVRGPIQEPLIEALDQVTAVFIAAEDNTCYLGRARPVGHELTETCQS